MPQIPIIGANDEQAERVNEMLRKINPAVMPSAILFVPSDKYYQARKGYGLQTPRNTTDTMFTHIPSGRIFVDAGKYSPDDNKNLWYWLNHELGHLQQKPTKDYSQGENQAENLAGPMRKAYNQMHGTEYLGVRQGIQQNTNDFMQRGRSGAAAPQTRNSVFFGSK